MGRRPFEDVSFLVTGGTRGLGSAIVQAAARQGARVVFSGRETSIALAERVLADTRAEGADGRVFFVPADMVVESQIERLFDAALERVPRIDVVINNAAVVRERLLLDITLEEWNETLATNLRGPFLTCRRAIEVFLGDGLGGRIVNVSSIAANGLAGQADYAASKSGLLTLTRCIAKEYGRRGIRCNSVVPGYLDIGMTATLSAEARRARELLSPHHRFGRTDEVVEAILFLASDDASYVNGDAIYVAGAVREPP
jgi:3-oxoacyl-[acyl-carrier protein] reductase